MISPSDLCLAFPSPPPSSLSLSLPLRNGTSPFMGMRFADRAGHCNPISLISQRKNRRTSFLLARRRRNAPHRLSAFAGRSPYLESPSVPSMPRAHNLKRVYAVYAPSGVHTAVRSHSPYISLRRELLCAGEGERRWQ